MPPSRSHTLGAKVLFETLKLLKEAGGSMRRKEVIEQIEQRLQLNDWESARAGKHRRKRWVSHLWFTTEATRAGFMKKSKGMWTVTPDGIKALELGKQDLLDAAILAYKEWYVARKKSEENDETRTKKLGAWARSQILRAGMQLLEGAPGSSLATKEFLRRLPGQLPEDLLEALEEHSPDWPRDYGYRTFYRAARADWLDRSGGKWTLNDSGKKALAQIPDAKELWETARKLVSGGGEAKEKLPYLGTISDYYNVAPTLYRPQSATVGQLVSDIQQGTLALPDIQRPFVWRNTKVRDLLDSMFRGFPIGYILTWKNPTESSTRTIGTADKGVSLPHALVIDGQQRLTSLYTVMTGEPILDKTFRERRIRIAFHPIQGTFEVTDAAIEKNPEWLPDISTLFTDSLGAMSVIRKYLGRLELAREIENKHQLAVERNIQRLVNLRHTQLRVLEVGLDADEEQVAEIFVRINSKGQNLKQADFILTLLAVFWDEGREQLEDFSRACRKPSADNTASPFNRQIQPGADDMIRVIIAFGHGRARLSAAYQVLRGKDPDTGTLTEKARDRNLEILKNAQERVLNPGNWHEFLKMLSTAGFRSAKQIQSVNTALYAYAFFLLGREKYDVPLYELRSLVARWYTMSGITGRYVGGGSETTMEEDLARLRGLKKGDADGFSRALEEAMRAELTNDFWAVTLPSRLESSSLRTAAPFFASQCVLGAKALFSTLMVSELLDPQTVSTRENLEVHHLFPKAWLKRNGFDSPREYNQIANYALLEWSDNALVADRTPNEYGPELEARVPESERSPVFELHALPVAWWELSYPEFLSQRRVLMANVIRLGFDRLSEVARPRG